MLLKEVLVPGIYITFISILIQIAILILVSFGIISLLMKWAGTAYMIKDNEIIVLSC